MCERVKVTQSKYNSVYSKECLPSNSHRFSWKWTLILHISGPPSSGPPSLARPIPPRDRTKMDRMLEYLLGDGPQHKYALICQKCASHNGMALKEEFEYIGEFMITSSPCIIHIQ